VAELGDEADLFSAGLTSHATVNVMLAIEDALGIEFPDELLNRSTFVSIESLAAAVETSRGQR
jgi:acyl carrier protein